LSSDDERRIEAEQCPRCRSLLRQYIEFSGGAIDDKDGRDRVRERLTRFLDETVRLGGMPLGREPEGFWTRISKVMRSRSAFAAAAVVAAAIVIGILVPWHGGDKDRIVLRGEGEAVARFGLPPADLSVPEHILLHWPRVPGAQSYRVVIYDASFNEVVSKIVTDTLLTVPTSDLTDAWQATPALLWEVEALRQGDIVRRSESGLLQKP
jgi:hypothetical protein